jgi:hypothetical protein
MPSRGESTTAITGLHWAGNIPSFGEERLIGAPISIRLFTGTRSYILALTVFSYSNTSCAGDYPTAWFLAAPDKLTKGEKDSKNLGSWRGSRFAASEERDCDERQTLDSTGQLIVPYLPPRVR